jgi:hypothetical protein
MTEQRKGRQSRKYPAHHVIKKLRTLEARQAKSPRSCDPGSQRYIAYTTYRDGATVAETLAALAKAGVRNPSEAINRDCKYGHIAIAEPSPKTKDPATLARQLRAIADELEPPRKGIE